MSVRGRTSGNTVHPVAPRPKGAVSQGVRADRSRPTIVDEITDQLAYRIAAGIYRPGELLPSVRQLAVEFSASAPTANSALGRLAALGFAEPRRGLGYIVRDIQLYGGIDTWRYLFRFAHRIPEQASRLFSDIIDVDHILVMQAVRAFVENPRHYDVSAATRALDRMEMLVHDPQATLIDIMAAELHMLRCTFAALGSIGSLSLFNTVGELLITMPEAAQAFYEPLEPEGHVVIGRTLQSLQTAGDPLDIPDLSLVETVMRTYHDQVVEAFHRLITAPAT
ncbi:FadR/GntR family transcriptional regulator [Nocardia sp. NPDC058058]|uniref:FadR/GntR family transcriptional regulator n=1 Tax=Nocardia sp. NPDC058058 TaxID=3346317 RepID=UPI0036DDDA08